jgi:hypothetical protein
MTDATALLKAEIDRVGALVAALKAQREALRKTRAAIKARTAEVTAAPASDAAGRQVIEKTLAHLRIEDEQTAEHERLIDHQLAERAKSLKVLAESLEMNQDSSIV